MTSWAGFNLNENIHFLDHLGVICALMEIPIIVKEDLNYELATKYYPDLTVKQIDSLDPETLYSHYDACFLSEYWDIASVRSRFQALEKKYNKELRIVHCPHGFSDKFYYLDKCSEEDIVLVYGQNMLDMFKNNPLKSPIMVGNYRYTYFKKHKSFYDKIYEDEIAFPKDLPTILYAPTWQDSLDSSTFFDACTTLIEQLSPHYNLIVKLHPCLERHDIALYYSILGAHEDNKNVHFLCEFPPIYPLLAHTDIYIGDTSSIGYDFLFFDKPMFFLNKFNEDPEKTPRIHLYRCGTMVTPDQYADIHNIIEKALPQDKENYSSIRKEMNDYTFTKEKPANEIKENILKLIR